MNLLLEPNPLSLLKGISLKDVLTEIKNNKYKAET